MEQELRAIRHRLEAIAIFVLVIIMNITDGSTPWVAFGCVVVLLVIWDDRVSAWLERHRGAKASR